MIDQHAHSKVIVGHMRIGRGPVCTHPFGMVIAEADGGKTGNIVQRNQRIKIMFPLVKTDGVHGFETIGCKNRRMIFQ